ncbi:MAG: DEAD/DEAH box helicase family protein [Chitinophagales bacterium]
MELKPYQHQVIKDLENYLEYLNQFQSPAKAFNEYWKDKVGEYKVNLDGSSTGMRPYKDNIPNAVHIAIKVPTAGGKTFIACNALSTINKHFSQGNAKAVVWLVPWSNLLQQTVGNLSDPSHPYREKLNSLFSNRVEVYEKEQLLQGANFNPTSVTEQLNIFVFNFSSLRINSRKKDDRKVFQENGALEAFRDTVIDNDLVLPETDETALINVIRSLNPIVIVDESHNAESDLSVEMLNNLNPSLVLDLTATPKGNSNIISFVSALALKKEHMVKLPVIVYNHHKKEEVISSALHLQRQLELLAKQEEENGGKYIRPIILFQAQSNIKGKDNTTFQKIKDQLVKLKIPEEQIKIKVSGIDELKGIDLMDANCPVRYIITINALKEGWDCPNAYILASLADKSSPVEVEQILGRVLRQPYVTKHAKDLLNLCFVLVASSKFKETLDNIVKGLQDAGFSKEDYYAEEIATTELSDDEVLQQELFGDTDDEVKSDDEFDIDKVDFDFDDEANLVESNSGNEIVDQITNKAITEGEAFEEKIKDTDLDDTTTYFAELMDKQPKKYSVDSNLAELASTIQLPQFFKKVEEEISDGVLFEELTAYEVLLHNNSLLEGFKLANQNTLIDFEDSADVYKVDFDKSKNTTTVQKISKRAKSLLMDNILSSPKESQIEKVSNIIVSKLGDMTPISQPDIKKFVNRVFESLNTEQIRDIVDNDFKYTAKIKERINELKKQYAKDKFQVLLDSNAIFVKDNFQFKESITIANPSTPIGKSLYEREDKMNNHEQEVIMDIAALENVLFWHRNMEYGKGFYLNGFSSNHYPDFIIYTKRKNIILLETKGDHLDNDDSRDKNRLGKVWAEKAGDNYKYFMVFQKKEVKDCYTAKSVIEVIKNL